MKKTAYETVRKSARESFRDFVDKRSRIFPTVMQRMSQGHGVLIGLSRLSAFFPLPNFRTRNAKQIFLSARYGELIGQFHGDEAVIVGGPNELLASWRLKKRFRSSVDLYSAAFNILFATRCVPTNLVIARWMRFFARQQDPCYLIVPNDTSPHSLLLAKIANRCSNVRVVCIQHGLFNSGYDLDDIEGRNSDINLVYSDAQRDEMLRRLPGAIVEVMGYPAEFRPLAYPAPETPHVLLVGTGAVEHWSVYKKSLDIFKSIERILSEAKAKIEYRPHPVEKPTTLASHEFSLNMESKDRLLSGERKVFIGFTSTLLYEAHLSGHMVVILDDPDLPGYKIDRFGFMVDSNDLHSLTGIILDNFRAQDPQSFYPNSLRERYEAALGRAEAGLANLPTRKAIF
jgi:hypothetical protein